MLTYPRGKNKIKADYKFVELYNFYKEVHGEKALSKEVVKKVYSKLFPEIVKLIVFDNLDFRMPARLGYIRVKKKLIEPKIDDQGNLDARRLSVDWKKTNKLWQKLYPEKSREELKQMKDKPLVRELNESTNGYRVTWYWDKTTCNIKNQNAYYINMTRDNDKILSRGTKLNNLNFYE